MERLSLAAYLDQEWGQSDVERGSRSIWDHQPRRRDDEQSSGRLQGDRDSQYQKGMA